MYFYTRRKFLQLSTCGAVSLVLPQRVWAQNSTKELAFYNLHTDEKLRLVYYEKEAYVPSALSALNRLLRDWRTGDVSPIDPALFDQLYTLQQLVERREPYHVICGFRTPKTNQSLANHSGGVAKHSLHMQGKAIDIALPGMNISQLHEAALGMKAGGVGYYPDSGFIHLDTGRVRHWS